MSKLAFQKHGHTSLVAGFKPTPLIILQLLLPDQGPHSRFPDPNVRQGRRETKARAREVEVGASGRDAAAEGGGAAQRASSKGTVLVQQARHRRRQGRAHVSRCQGSSLSHHAA